ncbi:MAG: ornithine cyclodeaminase family protein [Candidatus Hodarchaeota archaeon]
MKKLEVLFLGQDEVKNFLNMKQVIAEIRKVFESHGRESFVLPDPIKILLPLEPSINGHFVAMPAYIDLNQKSVAGVKWISTFPDNPKKHGLRTSSAVVIINDPWTGVPVCLMEASLLTAYRTGASTAVGASYLAKKDSHVIAIIGASFQGRYQMLALAEIFSLNECRVFDIDNKAAGIFRSEMLERLPGTEIKICESYEEAISGSDIVVTVTTASSPFFEGRWCEQGMLLVSMAAGPELKPEVLDRADKIVVDTISGCMHLGELAPYFESGQLKERDIYSDLGRIVVGKKKGRENEDEIILYVHSGVGTEDVAVARKIYELAKAHGKGTMLSLA